MKYNNMKHVYCSTESSSRQCYKCQRYSQPSAPSVELNKIPSAQLQKDEFCASEAGTFRVRLHFQHIFVAGFGRSG